jgi:cell division protein FtsB
MNKIKTVLKRYAGSKYILTLVIFGTWLIFFDKANIVSWMNDVNDVKNKQNQKLYYQKEIERIKESIEAFNDDELLEKYAREHLYMKNDDEDVYIIEEDDDEEE